MRRFAAALIVLVSIFVLVSLVSCKEEVSDTGYSTPTLQGKVSIPSGAGVSGGDFYIQVMDGDNVVYTGSTESDGTFIVSGLDASKTYDVLVTTEEPESIASRFVSKDASKGFGGWLSNVTATVGQANNVGSVKVKPLGTIKGKVSIDDIANNAVFVYVPGTSYIGITDEEGNFSISNMAQATYRLRFMADGYIAKVIEDIVIYSDDDATPPEKTVEAITLVKKVGVVEGFAVLDGVADSSGIGIRLEAEDGTNYAALTSTTGAYRIDNIVPGSYRIIASYANYPSVSSGSINVEAGKTTILEDKITLIENYGVVKGSAGLADSDVVSGISILFTNKSTGYSYSTVTGTDGLFSKQVRPGTYSVVASYANHESQTMDVTVVIDSTISVELPKLALSSGSVNGKVLLEGETNYTGATVAAILTNDESKMYSTTTLEDGSYYIGGILPGTYSIQIQKSGFVTDRSQTVVVAGGNSTSVNSVTLSSTTSTVKGTVTLDGSNDHTGVTILLKSSADDSKWYSSTTDQNGNYTITKVVPGDYILYASKAGYETKIIKDLTVETSTTKTINTQTLSVAIRSITGSVELELKDDHAGALVTATNLADSDVIYTAITNSSGDYTLAGMQPGEYMIVITNTGYRSATLPTISVVADSTADMGKTNLVINRGTIYGKATLEGRTNSAEVKVELMQGTEVYETKYTDEIGDYSFYVPQGNYSGVRFSMVDFKGDSDQDVIALFADNYVKITEVELEATHNTIKGTVDVFKGLEDVENSNVKVYLENHNEIAPVITGEDGAFVLEHVPVSESSYNLRIERENCSSLLIQVKVKAADVIDLGVISMYSNTGTIKGQAVIDDEYDSSGILVSAETDNGALTTYTDTTGRYELGGIPAGQDVTVKYSKDGWDTVSSQINPVLEALEVREMGAVTLTDSIVPTIQNVSINSGSNTTTSRTVNVSISASDAGSGITLVQYTWTDNFDLSEWKNYNGGNLTLTIPDETNGDKTITLRVRDKSGNMSEITTQTITLTDQYKVYHGTLSGDDLQWTKEKSPIVISGDIVIQNGTILVIEPGVDVLFDGNYSINVEGYIQAIGTNDECITFNSSQGFVADTLGNNGYYESWGGIKCSNNPLTVNCKTYPVSYVSGSIISHACIKKLQEGISGNIMIEDCSIEANGYALYRSNGPLVNNELVGDFYNFVSRYCYGNIFSSPNDSVCRFYPDGNTELLFNNYFYKLSLDVSEGTRYINCTFDSCYAGEFLADVENCEFVNLNDALMVGGYINQKIILSNFIDNNLDNIVDSRYVFASGLPSLSSRVLSFYDKRIDLKNNYWGQYNTNELIYNDKSGYKNNSFILNYYDDKFRGRTDESNYRVTPWTTAGYKGESLVAFDATCSKKELTVGSDVNINLTMLTNGEIEYYRMSQTLTGLLESEWISYTGECVYQSDDIDEKLIPFAGSLDIFVQCKTNTVEMPIRVVSVGYSIPDILHCSLYDNNYFIDDTSYSVNLFVYNYSFSNYGVSFETNVFVDGKKMVLDSDDVLRIPNTNMNVLDFLLCCSEFTNGKHEALIKLTSYNTDNNYETTIPFYVDRPVPTCGSLSINNDGAVVASGGTLLLDVPIENAKHLKTLNVMSGETVLLTKEYEDYNESSLTESLEVDCSSFDAGEHYVTIQLVDYTGNTTKAATDMFTVE